MVFWWISRSRIHLARSLAKLVFEQQYGVLRSKSRFYPFRKTWFSMIFLIFFNTGFGIDFWWVSASISAPFREPFSINSMFFHDRFLGWFFDAIFMRFNGKCLPNWSGETSSRLTIFDPKARPKARPQHNLEFPWFWHRFRLPFWCHFKGFGSRISCFYVFRVPYGSMAIVCGHTCGHS